MIRLELWNGARGQREKRVLLDFEAAIPDLPVTEAVWGEAFQLARRCRAAGVTVPATDILIAACAAHHGAALEHADADFELINGVPR